LFLRPCFLVVDREFAGSISSRKLVIETAKFNVVTAYSYDEGLATLERLPGLDGVVVTSDTRGLAASFLRTVRSKYPAMKLVMTGDAIGDDVPCDRCVEGFAPDKLLKALRELFPEDAAEVEHIEEKLEREEKTP
jgi:hypothetical protein